MEMSLLVMKKVNQRFSCFSRYARKRGLLVLLLGLILCEFAVGGAYSEVETSFVIMSSEDTAGSSNFWYMYGDYLLASLMVLIVVAIYLNAFKCPKKKRR